MILCKGFSEGFRLNYFGPRCRIESKNLHSVIQNPGVAWEKVMSEVKNGRIAGPFLTRPISNLRCSPIGVIPKKTGGFRLITHLSFPPNLSVNDFIDEKFTTVKYSSFDNAIDMIKRLGSNVEIGKKDIKSAFRLLKIYPGDFDLLGFKLNEYYFIDKSLPMGYSESNCLFKKFSTFIQWAVMTESNSDNLDHYLDDFLFAGKSNTEDCKNLMNSFDRVCCRLGVPIAHEKTEGPTTKLSYLGLLIDTEKMLIQIPEDKVLELKSKIKWVLGRKKITLRDLQSLCGSLAFCAKALPAGRAFSRRIYLASSHAKKPHHYVRITEGIYQDLLVWELFLDKFNGISYMLDIDWTSNSVLQLFTDSAGGSTKGCGCYFQGKWAFLKWPVEWSGTEVLRDISYLEMIPIALYVYLWGNLFQKKKILFNSDNNAVVEILNKKTSKSIRIMNLVRHIVYWSLLGNFHIKAQFIPGYTNIIADCISRKKFQKFKSLALTADTHPATIPEEFWNILDQK
ncbi:uncharacterized protein LOC134710223 isoform X1 [Mytilus trossulus]|uniref:uncharacterized protein LOC134710223 isoform X1 n=1 Tax=Mytilus trossulus TaxID=6551 RepID=UPI0030060978